MRNIIAIFKKEFKIYFETPVAYVVFGIFSLISGYFFLQIFSYFQRQSLQFLQYQAAHMLEHMNLNDMVMRPLFLNINVFFLLMIPVITMRLIADEKRLKTYELLMTSPVTTWQIVLGKYLASLSVILVMVLIVFIYPMLLSFFGSEGGLSTGSIEWMPLLTSGIGLFLAGASFAALGIFASSLTESQIISAIVSFGLLLLFWVIGWASAGAEGILKEVLRYLSLLEHLDQFTKGLIEVKDIVYYFSVIYFGLFLTQQSISSQRWR
ncbi:MAG: ABC transporter permease subunit [Deltaproteobacteria bacterium]|nr:ABC transporter permease subunit [Deltaproteobacteria bacterium]